MCVCACVRACVRAYDMCTMCVGGMNKEICYGLDSAYDMPE